MPLIQKKPDNMRIVHIANGNSIHTQRWVNYFARNGHQVHLISVKEMAGYDDNVHIHLLKRLSPRMWTLSKYLSFLVLVFQARKLVRTIRPDIVNGQYISVYGLLTAFSGFHPMVNTAMGSDILIDPKRNLLRRFFIKYVLKKSDIIIYDSETVKKELIELGTDPAKMRLVLNGVDTQKFSPTMKNEDIRNRWHVGRAPLAICFRAFKPVYNVETVIRAIPLVLSQLADAKFIIGGDGELSEQLKSLVVSLGISEAVRFTGFIPYDEVPGYLASSDVYVSTSFSDSTSLSLQEAMACALAPVVSDLPANREWITDGENGFIVSQNNIQDLADRMAYLLKNDELRKRFGRLGREIIKDRAEYHKEMEGLEKLYEELSPCKQGVVSN
ncbi:glycosyltransferase family 4 protein [Chloroflexota bacterium]